MERSIVESFLDFIDNYSGLAPRSKEEERIYNIIENMYDKPEYRVIMDELYPLSSPERSLVLDRLVEEGILKADRPKLKSLEKDGFTNILQLGILVLFSSGLLTILAYFISKC